MKDTRLNCLNDNAIYIYEYSGRGFCNFKDSRILSEDQSSWQSWVLSHQHCLVVTDRVVLPRKEII